MRFFSTTDVTKCTPKKKPFRKLSQVNQDSLSTMAGSSKSVFSGLKAAQSLSTRKYRSRKILKREELMSRFKDLLIESGLINNSLEQKMNFFYGPYEDPEAETSHRTKIDFNALEKIAKACKGDNPDGLRRQKWVAVLEHIADVNRENFRDFVSKLTPAMFPYIQTMAEKACMKGLDGKPIVTKLPPLEGSRERSRSLEHAFSSVR